MSWSDDPVAYQREWCRHKAKAKYEALRAKGTHCPYRNCGCALVFSVDQLGRVRTNCPWCERREAGICRGCPKTIRGKNRAAIWCASCAKLALKAAVARYQKLNPEKVKAAQRETKRRWREKHPEESRRRVRAYQKRHPRMVRVKQKAWQERNREWWWPKQKRYYRKRNRLLRKLGVPNLTTARALGLVA